MSDRVQPFAFPAQHPRPHLVPLVRPYLPFEAASYRAELDRETVLLHSEKAVTVFVALAVDSGGE